MVAETKQCVSKMFDSMNDAVRAAFDAGRRTQETWLKTSKDAWQQPGDFNHFFTASEQIARDWMPVMQKNVEAAANVFGANVRAGMEVMNAACDMTSKNENGSMYDKTRRMWDSAFDFARANVDFVTRTTARTMENCTGFCESFKPGDFTGKPVTETSTTGKSGR